MTSALLFERNQKSAEAQELVSVVMTSAYLLEEAGISNADVSISVRHTVEAGVHLWSLGVLTAAGCGIGSVHELSVFGALCDFKCSRTSSYWSSRSVARKWKEDDELALTSAEEIWNLSNGYIRTEAIYSRRLEGRDRRLLIERRDKNRGKIPGDEAADHH
ncbi:cysteine protease [Dorcoceras hygrometricum]|uniref:Cysteine protease n=1 Tax=Dorcoceras hygrometricum TaxID=472368 RepID=A0A2Z7BDS0_9LAMI|nr:cysteine protease [Dorcoceras hygrometricum]